MYLGHRSGLALRCSAMICPRQLNYNDASTNELMSFSSNVELYTKLDVRQLMISRPFRKSPSTIPWVLPHMPLQGGEVLTLT